MHGQKALPQLRNFRGGFDVVIAGRFGFAKDEQIEELELGGDVKETTIELADNTLQMTVDLGGSARTAGQYLVTVEAPGRYSFKKAPPAPQ